MFAGCGAIVVNAERDGSIGALGISAVFGLVIMAMIYATGHLSGAHWNPAVTVAFMIRRHFPGRDAAAYIPAQSSARRRRACTPACLGRDTGASRHRPHRRHGTGSRDETTPTAFPIPVIMAAATHTRAVGAVTVIAVGGRSASTYSSAAASPAIDEPGALLGPALAANEWTDFWIYIVGPLAGALIGALLYPAVRGPAPGEPAHVRGPSD